MLSIIQEACNKSKDRVANHCQVHIKFPDFSKLFHILCNWTFCDQTNLMQIICGYFSVHLCRVCKYRPITSPRVGFVCKMSSYHFDTLCDTFSTFRPFSSCLLHSLQLHTTRNNTFHDSANSPDFSRTTFKFGVFPCFVHYPGWWPPRKDDNEDASVQSAQTVLYPHHDKS